MNRRFLSLLLALTCLVIRCVASEPIRYYAYVDKSFNGISLASIAEGVNQEIDKNAGDLRPFVTLDSIKMGPFWRKSRSTDVLTNNGWCIAIKNGQIVGRLYLTCVPVSGSLDADLIPVHYVEFLLKHEKHKLEVIKFERVLVMNY